MIYTWDDADPNNDALGISFSDALLKGAGKGLQAAYKNEKLTTYLPFLKKFSLTKRGEAVAVGISQELEARKRALQERENQRLAAEAKQALEVRSQSLRGRIGGGLSTITERVNELPEWVLPAAIGSGVVVVVVLLARRG